MKPQETHTTATVYTIGHSTHPIEKFIEMLKAHDIRLLADVRTIPKSRHNPQYNSDALAASLRENGIGYMHMPGLGGLRHAKKGSANTGWKTESFQGYADYMLTGEFEAHLRELIVLAKEKTTTIMCAEAVPWRCHRSLIGDALLVRRVQVMDIMSRTSVKPHAMTAWAVVKGTTITYPKPRAT